MTVFDRKYHIKYIDFFASLKLKQKTRQYLYTDEKKGRLAFLKSPKIHKMLTNKI